MKRMFDTRSSVGKQLLLCGGAVGHLMHLYDNRDMTFGEMKGILTKAASGKLQKVSEKLDGLNLVFTWDVSGDGLKVARAAGDIKRGGMDAESLAAKFQGRGNLSDAFNSAFKVLRGAISSLPAKTLSAVFGPQGNRWYSVEVIYTDNPNVINYDSNTIVFHGWPIMEMQDDGRVGTADDTSGADVLANQVEKMQNAVNVRGWKVQGPAVVRMKNISDKSILQNVLSEIDAAAQQAGVGDGDTMGSYIEAMLTDDVQKFGLPKNVSSMIVARVMGVLGAPSLIDIRKKADKSTHDDIKRFVKNSPELLKSYVRPIEVAINDFAVELLKGLESSLIDDSDEEVVRLRGEVASAIAAIESSGDETAMATLSRQMEKLKSVENITSPVEGVVFIWKGNAYKFTGSFASANSILGLFKYGRGGTKLKMASK